MGRLFIDCKSRCHVCLPIQVGENYSVGLSTDYRVGKLSSDCKCRCTVCLVIQSVYRLTNGWGEYIQSVYRPTIGWENYLSTVRVGVPSVSLFSRFIVRLSGGRIIYRLQESASRPSHYPVGPPSDYLIVRIIYRL